MTKRPEARDNFDFMNIKKQKAAKPTNDNLGRGYNFDNASWKDGIDNPDIYQAG